MAKLPAFALLSLLLFIASSHFTITLATSTFSRSCFPPKFIFGASSAAYQYEGAVSEGGRTPSIWDTFTHNFPEKIADGSNGDVANDFYHRYKGDVKLMKYLGLDVFRMSISWSRILPNGKLSGGINKEGVAFYNNVFNELLANGIIPFVTLFHWDVPQALEDEYGGFLSPRIINDYRDYVDVCFKEFGDRVKHWITLNEPFVFTSGGYDGNFVGNLAPGRCSNRTLCAAGDSSTEPYIVTRNLLLSHGVAVKLYKEKYQVLQKGIIGITLVSHWFVPFSNSALDVQAAQRILDFMLGWYLDPIVYGDYPSIMRSIVGDRLPKFSEEERKLLKGSFDFVGMNYYTGIYAAHVVSSPGNDTSSTADSMTSLTSFRNGVPIGDPTGVPIFFVFPQGLHDLLVYIKQKYKDPIIYITENGIGDFSNGTATAQQLIRDPQRIDFYRRHLKAILRAIGEGVKVKGFMAWTFMDDFEWGAGYTNLFGLLYVDRDNGLKRIFKLSALWYKKFLATK